MKGFLILSLVVAIAFASKHKFHNHPHPDEGHHHLHHHHKHWKCNGEPILPNQDFEQSRKECDKEGMKHEDEDGKGRACHVVCIMTKIGAFDEKGLIVESKLKHFIESTIVNQEARQEIAEGVIECGKNTTGLGIKSSDGDCSNYRPYFACTMEIFREACGSPDEEHSGEME